MPLGWFKSKAQKQAEKDLPARADVELEDKVENPLLKDYSLGWKYETGGSVESVAITQDGSRVVAGSGDDNIYLSSIVSIPKTPDKIHFRF